MTELKFIKQKKSQGIYEETGYYFGDEFLNRYKSKAIEILRNRIIKAGNGDFNSGKDKAKKEWEVVHTEYLKSIEAIKKTNRTKKPYWNKLNQLTIKNKINRLKEKSVYLKERKKDIVKDFDDRIKLIEKDIVKLREQIKKCHA
jgi:predicted N-acyltransferase